MYSKEDHKDQGHHYHMAIKLDRQKRWLSVRKDLDQKFGVKVHFSDKHSNYYEAWQYVTKHDNNYILSEGYPDLVNSALPRTTTATKVKRENHGVKRKKKIDALEVSEIILRNEIKSKTELLHLAKIQKEEGKTGLALYVLQHTDKVQKITDTTWEMEHSGGSLKRRKISRTDILKSFCSSECLDGCGGEWLRCAKITLQKNNLPKNKFSTAIISALEHGRGKGRNILIVGPANCGKTFILKPLQKIFHTFSNRSTNSFAWVGVEQAEIIFFE